MYAVSAIPIWMTKIGIWLAALFAFTRILVSGIQFLEGKFEDLLYGDWSTLFTGKNDNADSILHYDGNSSKFRFFPEPSSPFFIFWVLFLSVGFLLIFIMIAYKLGTIIAGTEDDEKPEKSSTGGITYRVITSIISMFLVPVVMFSSVTVISSVAKLIFKNHGNTISTTGYAEYRTNFSQSLTTASDELYKIGEHNELKATDGSENALYSHTGGGVIDPWDSYINSPSVVTHPLSTTIDVLDRIKYELTILENNSATLLPSDTMLQIQTSKANIAKLKSGILNSNTTQNTLNMIAAQAAKLSTTHDNSISTKINDTITELGKINTEILDVYNSITKIVIAKDDIMFSLKNIDSDIMTKINGFFNKSNPSNSVKALANTLPADLDHNQKAAALANIYSLTKNYLTPIGGFTKQMFSKDYTKTDKYVPINDHSLVGIANNIQALVFGYHKGDEYFSVENLAVLWSTHPTSKLVDIVNNVSKYNGSNPLVGVMVVIVGYFVAMMVFTILFQLFKRIGQRILMIGSLWLFGLWIIPLSIKDKGYSMKRWLSAVTTEIILVTTLALTFTMWKYITPLLLSDMGANTKGTWSIGPALLNTFITLALLEIVVKGADALTNLIGNGSSMGNVSANIRQNGRTLSRTSKNIHKGLSRNKAPGATPGKLPGAGGAGPKGGK